MSLLERVDAALLRVVDGAVLWVWNTFEVPRIVLIRLCMIGTVLAVGVRLGIEGITLSGIVLLGLVLCLGLIEEVAAATYSPRRMNIRLLQMRSHIMGFVARYFALTMPMPPYRDHPALEIIAGLFGMGLLWLTYALTPEGPPTRRTKLRLAPQAGAS